MCFYNNTHTRARSRRHGRRRSGVGCVSVCVSHISDLDICTNIVPAGVWWDEKENATNLDFGADNFVCRRKATSLIDFARSATMNPTPQLNLNICLGLTVKFWEICLWIL